jgi:hypothetical protein
LSTLLVCIFFAVLYISMSVNFKKVHNMGSDRTSVLEHVSYPIETCGDRATAVAVLLNGRTFGVTVGHFNCSGVCPKGFVPCKGLDISLAIGECPDTLFSLDVSTFTDPTIGDDAFVYGYSVTGHDIRNYRAVIGHEYGRIKDNPHFSYLPNFQPNARYLVGASQLAGFSGSAVLNGYGIIGVVAATVPGFAGAVMTPWSDVDQCIEEIMQTNTLFPDKCNSTTIRSPTLMNRAEVNLLPIVSNISYFQNVVTWLYENF